MSTLWLGTPHTLVQERLCFSKAALVTFGGAYAVLPYVAQQAVQTHRWLPTSQMLDGLGLAETTPGPLIIVTPFPGFCRRLEPVGVVLNLAVWFGLHVIVPPPGVVDGFAVLVGTVAFLGRVCGNHPTTSVALSSPARPEPSHSPSCG